jgi:hypothetical protein
MPVKETDRAEFVAFGDLGFDSDGREVLVGLSYEETEWYLDVLERDRSGRGLISDDEIDRKSGLDDRHAMARFQLAAPEYEAQPKARHRLQSWLIDNPRSPAIHPGAVAMADKARGKGSAI